MRSDKAFAQGTLTFFGQCSEFAEPGRFRTWLRQFKKTDWVVHAKPPLAGPEHVLKYLARYTHRVAISNGRLLSSDGGQVTFRWRDSKDGNHVKAMTLSAVAFIRRFLLHILPSGFVKIRHTGSWPIANARMPLLFAASTCRHHHPLTTPQ